MYLWTEELCVFLFALASSHEVAFAHSGLALFLVHAQALWQASSLDPTGPVSLTVDLGAPKKVQAIDINCIFMGRDNWNYPKTSISSVINKETIGAVSRTDDYSSSWKGFCCFAIRDTKEVC